MTCLKDFLQEVPICNQTDSLGLVLERFGWLATPNPATPSCGPTAVAVLDQDQQLLGLLTPQGILSCLLRQSNQATAVAKQPIATLEPQIILPCPTLQADLPLHQFQSYLQTQSPETMPETWALTTRCGQFLGLLSSHRILAHLLHHPGQAAPESATSTSPLMTVSDLPDSIDPLDLVARESGITELHQLKSEFLANLGHELKTPLTAVLGLVSVLKDGGVGLLSHRQSRYMQLIHQSSRQLMTMVNDMLDLALIEMRALELMPEQVEIATVCQQAFEQAKQVYFSKLEEPREQATQLPQFSLMIAPGLQTLVADSLRVRQMLLHLLVNAMKFTDETGQIGLDVSCWEGWISFKVWDTGIGIPAQRQHLVFQTLHQLENPLNSQFQGTGLGLMLTQQLAHLHGGDLTFTSTEGQGSEFTLLLPPHPPECSVEPQRQFSAHSDRIVLVVDAAKSRLSSLIPALSALEYRVVVARAGTEVLEKARRLQPCVILLNPVLPLMSGWDILALLVRDPDTCHIPVLLMGKQTERQHALQQGATDLIELPIVLPDLQAQIQAAMLTPRAATVTPAVPVTSPLVQLSTAGNSSSGWIGTNSETHLTVLWLGTPLLTPEAESELTATPQSAVAPLLNISRLLHGYPCRVLEAEDLAQADLLARIWEPQVMLCTQVPDNPINQYFYQLRQHPSLSNLPLVTLNPELTDAANQVPGLMVFPYLSPKNLGTAADTWDGQTLLQVLQLAAA